MKSKTNNPVKHHRFMIGFLCNGVKMREIISATDDYEARCELLKRYLYSKPSVFIVESVRM